MRQRTAGGHSSKLRKPAGGARSKQGSLEVWGHTASVQRGWRGSKPSRGRSLEVWEEVAEVQAQQEGAARPQAMPRQHEAPAVAAAARVQQHVMQHVVLLQMQGRGDEGKGGCAWKAGVGQGSGILARPQPAALVAAGHTWHANAADAPAATLAVIATPVSTHALACMSINVALAASRMPACAAN